MDLLKILAIAVVSIIAIVIVRPIKPEIAVILGVCTTILIILLVADDLFEVVYSFYSIAEKTNVDKSLFNNVIKIIGIGYLSEFGNTICEDSGCKSIGDKIIFAGKITIMILALPIIENLIEIILEILP